MSDEPQKIDVHQGLISEFVSTISIIIISRIKKIVYPLNFPEVQYILLLYTSGIKLYIMFYRLVCDDSNCLDPTGVGYLLRLAW